jgi:gamma-glutamylcyclotransferase (GGCT)/AIG2-like uncharacterized protein YtfP
MKVFVYGTLLKGMSRSHSLHNTQFIGLGMINASLYDLGAYPGIIESTDSVFGEIYTIDSITLVALDHIEGYDANYHDGSLYIRKEVDVTLLRDGSSIKAYTYFYNASDLETYYEIASGDYRRHILSSKPTWYIAYGSNMDSDRFIKRVGNFKKLRTGYLEGFELVFNKQGDNGSSYANIKYQGAGYRCPFVAYLIDEDQLDKLDVYEGEASHYIRLGMPFNTANSEKSNLGHVYIAHPNKLTDDALVNNEYLNFIRQGYSQHGF